MALQWSDPIKSNPKSKKPAPTIAPPAFSKHDVVFVLGMLDAEPTSSFSLCEIVNVGYRLQQRQHIYFCKAIEAPFVADTVIMCTDKYLRRPRYLAGTVLCVRDLDDRINGVGFVSDWKVCIQWMEFVGGRCVYWVQIPGMGNRRGGLLLDIEESKLERMVAAAAAARKKVTTTK